MTIEEAIAGMKAFGGWGQEIEAIEKIKADLAAATQRADDAEDEATTLAGTVDRLRAIVDKLPKDATGRHVIPNTEQVYHPNMPKEVLTEFW